MLRDIRPEDSQERNSRLKCGIFKDRDVNLVTLRAVFRQLNLHQVLTTKEYPPDVGPNAFFTDWFTWHWLSRLLYLRSLLTQ